MKLCRIGGRRKEINSPCRLLALQCLQVTMWPAVDKLCDSYEVRGLFRMKENERRCEGMSLVSLSAILPSLSNRIFLPYQ